MEIECKFYASSSLYSCDITKAEITKPNVNVVSFKGMHQQGKNNQNVTSVDFRDARVEYFPRNLQMIFPNLKTLRIENCGLKEIHREDLIGLEKLVSLNLRGNQLKSLPDDLFSNMPKLKDVFLSRNKIEFASSKLIEPIVGNQLRCFWLTRNTNIDEYYWSSMKRGCETIQELMARIDEKCKPPSPQMIAKPVAPQMIAKPATTQMIAKPATTQMITKSVQCGSNCHDAAERQFLRSFNEHRLSGRFSDFVIVVDSKEFLVHKNVLATQSPILDEMFEIKNGRSASKLQISDFSAESVEAFLAYLYERKLPAPRNAVEIFKLAAKYEVTKLKAICEGIIQDNLDESNAFEILKLACGPHKSEELKVAAFGKLQEKFEGGLDDELINDPDKLQKILEAKKVLDDLVNQSSAKKQRLI